MKKSKVLVSIEILHFDSKLLKIITLVNAFYR